MQIITMIIIMITEHIRSINILKYAVYKTTIAIKMSLNIRIGYHRK